MNKSDGNVVVVAMSGGVDSSVAAAHLAARGYEVIGVTLRLWRESDTESAVGPRSRSTFEYMDTAARVARSLGIQHMVMDVRDLFYKAVVEPFAAEYMRGRTPNPCVECNRRLKFPALVRAADEVGAAFVATGHYARLERGEKGMCSLLRALNRGKDQSYALYGLGQEILGRCLFPNGSKSKGEIREAAGTRSLEAAGKSESQEICFVSGDNYRHFLSDRFPEFSSPGPVVDTSGRELGEHRGIALYTIGQRKGLGVSAPYPMYVIALDAARRAVVVGRSEEVPGRRLRAEAVHWIKGDPPARSFQAEIMARYNAVPAPCRVDVAGDGFEVFCEERVWALTPGQHAVLYRGDEVLGGGIITSAG